jgi:hypothetical protein
VLPDAAPSEGGSSVVAGVAAADDVHRSDRARSDRLSSDRVSGDRPPARSRLEGPLWLLAGLVLAVLQSWPLLTQLGSHVPQDNADPLAESWEVAWSGYAILHHPLRLFSANAFWPEGPSLAFSDSQLGYLPASLLGSGPHAAIVRYNLLFLFAYGLAFCGAALLARELGARPAAAAVAGAAFAWAPWRIAHNGHLNILSTGGVALSLFLLASGYRRCRPWQVLAGWLVAAWQVTLGFALGIWFCYLLGALFVVFAVRWWRGARERPPGMLRATVVGCLAFLVVTVLMALPYLEVLRTYTDAPRSRAEVAFYSPPPRSLLAASVENRFWGPRTASIRKTLSWAPEQTLFPGVTVVLLAVVGVFWRRRSRWLRAGLVVTCAVAVVLSLGLSLAGGRFTYGPLYDHLPGWTGMRTPGRLAFVWSLALALLAAFGAERTAEWVRGLARRTARPGLLATAAVVPLVALVLYEGSADLPMAPVPPVPPGLAAVPAPQVHFPADAFHDNTYMYWSTAGFPLMANGNTSYLPPSLARIRDMTGFPDAASVAMLRAAGYRSVIVHLDLVPGTPWQDVAQRPTAGLGVTRRQDGQLLIFDLGP